MQITKLTACFICALLASCTTEDSSNLVAAAEEDGSLSGTWLAASKVTYSDLNGAKLGSATDYSSVYIAENSSEVLFSTCYKNYNPSSSPLVLVRTDDKLQEIGNAIEPFTIISDQALTHTSQQVLNLSIETYENTYTKISTAIISSGASLQLSGPVTAGNSTKACLLQRTSENKDVFTYNISIPLDSESMELIIETSQPLAIGNYVYDTTQRFNSPELSGFSIISNDGNFINIVGTNLLAPDVAILNITAADTESIKGSFSFTSQSGGNYSGDFSFIPYVTN